MRDTWRTPVHAAFQKKLGCTYTPTLPFLKRLKHSIKQLMSRAVNPPPPLPFHLSIHVYVHPVWIVFFSIPAKFSAWAFCRRRFLMRCPVWSAENKKRENTRGEDNPSWSKSTGIWRLLWIHRRIHPTAGKAMWSKRNEQVYIHLALWAAVNRKHAISLICSHYRSAQGLFFLYSSSLLSASSSPLLPCSLAPLYIYRPLYIQPRTAISIYHSLSVSRPPPKKNCRRRRKRTPLLCIQLASQNSPWTVQCSHE